MRGLTRRWIVPDHATEDREDTLFGRLVRWRGIGEGEALEAFFTPRLSQLHDPRRMHGLESAARRLVEALRAGRRVAIYGDYDVDGVTASSILWRILKVACPDAEVPIFIPHRVDDGYGLSAERLLELRREGADLVVSVDCGVTAVAEVEAANAAGLEMVITDHHEFARGEDGEVLLPPAAEVVHPRHPGADYPFGELCGAGVAFKLAWQFAREWCGSEQVGESFKRELVECLPLAALGTIADVVPLRDENRVLAATGLARLSACGIPGVRALLEQSDLVSGRSPDSEDVAFRLAPSLNACGRRGHAGAAARLFTEAGSEESRTIAAALARQNERRRRIERRIFEQACELAEARGMTGPDRRAIVLAHPEWHPGVVGIVCSRLVERFGRPAVLMCLADGVAKGSARSVDDYSILEGFEACREHLATFGGHAAAAGLKVEEDRLEAFTEALLGHAAERIGPDDLMPTIRIDGDAQLSELDARAMSDIERLAPFGRSNRPPSFRLTGVRIAAEPRVFGKQNDHLELQVTDGRGSFLRATWWRSVEHRGLLSKGAAIELVVEPKFDAYRGRREVVGSIRDVRVLEAALDERETASRSATFA
ncbi:MAG: single-stranded-DNA-specific exonuclease RecJ [Phycisphaerales bacterium]